MRNLENILVVDTTQANWRRRLPPALGSAIRQMSSARREGLMVLVEEPTVGQASRHAMSALAVLGRAVRRAIRGYCGRINRGYLAANYSYLLEKELP